MLKNKVGGLEIFAFLLILYQSKFSVFTTLLKFNVSVCPLRSQKLLKNIFIRKALNVKIS